MRCQREQSIAPLVLKRGLVADSNLVKWCMDAMLNFDIQPLNLLVILSHISDQKAKTVEPLMTWKVINAWPKKWSVSDLDAEKSAIAIETLELNYQYFELKPT
jgi:phage tail-like protein